MRRVKKVVGAMLTLTMVMQLGMSVMAKEDVRIKNKSLDPDYPPVRAETPDSVASDTMVDSALSTQPQVELMGLYLGEDAKLTSDDMAATWRQDFLESSRLVVKGGKFYDCLVKVILPEIADAEDTAVWCLEVRITSDSKDSKIRAEAHLEHDSTEFKAGVAKADLHYASSFKQFQGVIPLEQPEELTNDECAQAVEPLPSEFLDPTLQVEPQIRIFSYPYYKIGEQEGSTGCVLDVTAGGAGTELKMTGKTLKRIVAEQEDIYVLVRMYAMPEL